MANTFNHNDKVVITDGGDVGIGTSSPNVKLDVVGNIGINSTNPKLYVTRNDGTYVPIIQLETSSDDVLVGYTNIDALRLYDDSGEVMRLDGTGNVGIGTTSPNTKLRIVDSTTNPPLSIQSTNANGYSGSWLYDSAGTLVGHFGWANGTTSTLSDKVYFGTIANKDVVFTTNDTEKVRITAGGNVGIGTTSPVDRLHVEGSVTLSNSSPEVTFQTGATHYNWQIAAQENVNAAFEISVGSQDAAASNDTWSPKLVVLQSGNVGIGTTSPGKKLEVREVADTESSIRIRQLSYNYWDLKSPASDTDFTISDVGGEKLRITSDGNVGIGTTSPSTTLQVVGTITAPTIKTESAATVLDNSGIQPAQDEVEDIVQFKWSGTKVSSIDNEGNYTGGLTTTSSVGIGTLSPTSRLHVNNSVSNPDLDVPVSYAVEIDSNHSGSSATTSDREQGALFIDVDSSTTGGDTSNEHRVWAIYSDTRFTGDADDVAAGYFTTEQNSTAGTSTWVRGIYGLAVSDGGASASLTNMVAVGAMTNAQDSTPIVNSIGVSGHSYVNANRSGNITNVIGGSFEAEFNSDSMSVTDATAILGVIDINADATITNSRLLHLYYEGVSPATNTWSIYSESNYPSYFAGNVGIGTTSPNASLHIEKAGDQSSSVKGITLSSGAAGTNKYLPSIVWSYGANGTPDFAKIESQRSLGTGARILFSTANTSGTMSEAMRIDESGNVGIGTTSPTTKLYVDAGESTFNRGNSDGAIARFRGKNAEKAVIGTVDSWFSGKVGIGTTSPAGKLSVLLGETNLSTASAAATTGYPLSIRFTGTGSDSNLIRHEASANPTGYYTLIGTRYDYNKSFLISNKGSELMSYSDSTSIGLLLNGGAANLFRVATNGAERMRITSAGNVGIGTTTANTLLSIDGKADDGISIQGIGTTATRAFFGLDTSGDGYLSLTNGGTFAKNVQLTSDLSVANYIMGNVGIGTTSPGAKLDVSDAQPVIRITNTEDKTWDSGNNIGKLEFYTKDSSSPNGTKVAAYIQTITDVASSVPAGALVFATSPGGGASVAASEVMRISGHSGGNVGIGTTSPAYKLEVSGGAISIKGNAAGNSLRFDDSGGTSRNAMYVDTSNYLNVGNANYAGIKFYHTATAPTANSLEGNQIAEGYGTTDEGKVLADPDAWLAVRVGTTDYAIPMYTTG